MIYARRLGVSRIPVREALQRLEGEGLVKICLQGAVVAEFKMRDVRESSSPGLLEGAQPGLLLQDDI